MPNSNQATLALFSLISFRVKMQDQVNINSWKIVYFPKTQFCSGQWPIVQQSEFLSRSLKS